MLHQHPSKIQNGLNDRSVSQVSDWMDNRHRNTVADVDADTAVPSAEDLLAIYECFDFLERVWPTEPLLQQTAGPFTLEEEIGRGGMGRVWSAIQHEPVKRNVAVKLINPGPQTQQMVKRFESERSMLALMNHPAIATLINAGQTDDGQLYFAMEMVDGPDLISYCNQNKLSIEQRLNLFLDACSAVQHAHQKGIIHRDLKPSNILVTEVDDHARLKVIDFGLSKLHSTTPDIADSTGSRFVQAQPIDATQAGQVVGSLRYMSPEQAAADLAGIDVRSDIYSLGVVLFKLLTDSTPLDFKDLNDVPVERLLDLIQFQEDPSPSEYLEGLSKEGVEEIISTRQASAAGYRRLLKSDLDWITMQALAKNPESRYQTVAEFANDINRFLNHEPVSARPESLTYNVRKELRKNRVLWASMTGIIVALLAGVLLFGYGLASAINSQSVAEKRLEQSRKSNQILSEIFSGLDLLTIGMETEPFKVVVGRKLVQAAEGLDIDSVGDPLEVVGLKIRLAEALNGLEFFEDAVPISREAWDSIQNLDSEENADLNYRAGIALVRGLTGNARPIEASEILDPLYSKCRSSQGEDSETCLELLLLKGQVAVLNGDDYLARQCFTEVVDRRRSLWGKSDLRTLDAMFWLTDVYVEPGQPYANIPMADEVTEQYRRLLPKRHPRLIKAILNNAWVRSYSGNFKQTALLANEGLELAIETYGENHSTTYDAMLVVGLLTHRNGDHQEGARLLEKAWTGLSETAGASHPRAITAITVLADMSDQAGDVKNAIKLLEKALLLSPPNSGIEIKLADLHIETGNLDTARQLLKQAMSDAKGSNQESEKVSRCMYLMGRCLMKEGEYVAAIEAFEQSIGLAPPTENLYDFVGMRKVLELSRSHDMSGNLPRAREVIEEYLAAMPDSMGPKNWVRLCCQAELGLIFRRTGKTDEAIAKLLHVLKSGVILRHHDYLVHELRLAQADKGLTDDILRGVNRELKFLHKTFAKNSIQGAIRLKGLGYNLIELELLDKAKEVLSEAATIFDAASPGSWMQVKTRFDIAILDLELQAPESIVRPAAAERLEETWEQLAEMLDDAIPSNIEKLADSVDAVISVYQKESDVETEAIWQKRLATLPLGLATIE